MKKLFLLSIFLIGLGLTACQKDEMPEAPAAQTEAYGTADGYLLTPTEVHFSCYGPENPREITLTLTRNGSPVRDNLRMSDFKLEDYDSYNRITPYIEIAGTGWSTVTLRVKPVPYPYDLPPTKGYLNYKTPTGQTIWADVWMHYYIASPL